MTSPIATWHPKAHFTSRIWNVRNSDLGFKSVPVKELREAAGHLTEVLGRQLLGPFSKWPSMQDSLSKAEENALKLFGITSSLITFKRRSRAGTPRLIEQDCKEWLKGKLWISPGIPLHDEMLDRFFECFKEVETDNWQILCFPSELEVPDTRVDPLKKKRIATRQKKQVKSRAVIKLAKTLEHFKKKKPAKDATPDDDQSIWFRTEPYLDVGNALILNTAFGTTREKLLPKPQVPKAPRRKNVLDHTKIHELVRLTLDKNLTCDSIAKQIRISRASVAHSPPISCNTRGLSSRDARRNFCFRIGHTKVVAALF